jgi:hypothetical protein
MRLDELEHCKYEDCRTMSEQNAHCIIQIDKKMRNNSYNFSVVELQHIIKCVTFSLLTDYKDDARFDKICQIVKMSCDDVEHSEQYVEYIYDVLHYDNDELDRQIKILENLAQII